MKKIIALLLALAMVLSMAACAQSNNASDTSTSDTSGEESATTAETGGTTVAADGTVTTEYKESEGVTTDKELPHFKILVMYASFTDKLGSQFKSSLEYLAKDLNVEFTFLETGMDSDAAMTAAQAALVTGYDGGIGVYANEAYAKMFQDAGVPYIASGGMPSTQELADTLAANYDMYLGSVVVDDYAAGVNMADALYRDGCRNVMWNGLQRGLSGQHDQRTLGFADGVAAHEDMNLISENFDRTTWADGIATAAATYPELDGVACSALAENIYNTIDTEGLNGYIHLAGIDITESVGRFFEEGTLSYIAGGNYVTEMIAFAVLYNYLLDGTRIIADPSQNLMFNNIDINNLEEFNNYIKYLDSGIPAYTAQEILEMTHYYDESFGPEDMIEIGQQYSLEDVMARHADLFEE